MKLTTIFYYTDEFCKLFEQETKVRVLSSGKNKRDRKCSLILSEVMTILTYYHYSGYKTFKDYYEKCPDLRPAFHGMPSYNRFLELQQKAMIPLMIFAKLQSTGAITGVSFIDSFPLKVSHVKRASSHKTFNGLARKGKTSVGWFYGFKLHLIINHRGEILSFTITSGNVADNNAQLLEQLTEKMNGKIYGDKGYLTKPPVFEKLYNKGVHLITKIKCNMKNKLMEMHDKIMLRRRGVVESVGAVIKEDFNIEHSRYRNPSTLYINVFAGLIAYAFRDNKPSICLAKSGALTAW